MVKIPQKYCLFKRNICALNYVLNIENVNNSFLHSKSCDISICPYKNKNKCCNKDTRLSKKYVENLLENLGIDSQFSINGDTITFEKKLTVVEITYLQFVLNCNINFKDSKQLNKNEFYWASAITGSEDIFINDIIEDFSNV